MILFRVYLGVSSSTLQPEKITRRLRVSPDSFKRLGERLPPGGPDAPLRGHTDWVKEVFEVTDSARFEEVGRVVVGWGMPLAEELGRLAVDDADVSLNIVQKITDIEDPLEKGVWLSADLVRWLGVAKAAISIDQYVLHECFDGEVRRPSKT
ncbi:DUF4279 domain-containing protein [Amycolatopsis nigrescens]|uniref:DUF4279 domain-containing protein n=1 Tax=Amycolatopsis nigrescens TaxID=381445 RepID=UPI0009FE402B|nr:DUF4279 domain-containing protein [Amycolatopsis nigrescens]